MDRVQVDTLVQQLCAGRLGRRAFLARAAALGLSPIATALLLRKAGTQGASPVSSPTASPEASPIASPAARGHAMTSMTREEY